MPGLMEAATAVMRAAEVRLNVAARNVANVSSPGYKRQSTFVRAFAEGAGARSALPTIGSTTDPTQGKLDSTGHPLDLAISGAGFFAIKVGDHVRYTRQGQFSLRDDGVVVTPQGYMLQQVGGGDLVLNKAAVTVQTDGTVLDGDKPIARIAVYSSENALTTDGAFFDLGASAEEVQRPTIRQGMVEASNVSTGDEMIAVMAAVREAESGARLAQTYDDLLGRAITSFGQGGR